MASPVRTACSEEKHERESRTWLQSPHLSFNGWEGQGYVVFSKKGQDLRSRGFQGRPILCPNGEGATQRGVGERARSNSWHFGRRRFLWRRWTCWSASAHVVRN